MSNTINVNGTELPLSTFSPEVQSMVLLAIQWQKDLTKAESRVLQIKAALQIINGELNSKVSEELKARDRKIQELNESLRNAQVYHGEQL